MQTEEGICRQHNESASAAKSKRVPSVPTMRYQTQTLRYEPTTIGSPTYTLSATYLSGRSALDTLTTRRRRQPHNTIDKSPGGGGGSARKSVPTGYGDSLYGST